MFSACKVGVDDGCITLDSVRNPNYNPDSGAREPTDTDSGSREPSDREQDSNPKEPADRETDSNSREPADREPDSNSRVPADREPDSNSREPADRDREPDSNSREPADRDREPDSNSREPADRDREPDSNSREPADRDREPDSNSREPADRDREPDSNSREPADREPDSDTKNPMPEGNPEKADYTYSVTSDQITITRPDGSTSFIDIRGFTNLQLDPTRQVAYYLYNGYLYQKNWSGDGITTRKLVQLSSRVGDIVYLVSSGKIYYSDQSDMVEYDPVTGSKRTVAEGRSPAPGTLSVREDGTLMWMESSRGSLRLIQLILRDLTQQTVDLPNSFTGKERSISYLNTGSGGFLYFLRDGRFMRYSFETRRVEVIESGSVKFISGAVPRFGGVFYVTANRVSIL